MADAYEISELEREITVRVLQRLSEDPGLIQHDERMKALIAKIHRGGKKGERLAARDERRDADRTVQAHTAIVRRDLDRLPLAPAGGTTAIIGSRRQAIYCYTCKQPFTDVHFFYHLLCPTCAAFQIPGVMGLPTASSEMFVASEMIRPAVAR